jgi:hypothetical protein
MKHVLILLMSGLFAATSAQALTVGRKTCADAAVVADIVHQDYDSVRSDDPNVVFVDVILEIDLDVRRVRYGPVKRGPLHISGVAHTLLDESRVHGFYLHREKDRSWQIADCGVR